MEFLEKINSALNNVVWGVPMLTLIIATGVYMSVRTGFFQITRIREWMDATLFAIFKKKEVTKTKEKRAISQFQAMCTALSATLGTGNIAGVATAIAVGGPGAVFWMWISAFFGMMTNYAENVLGIYYRRKNDKGEWSGGAMYYLQDGLGSKKHMKKVGRVLAIAFACFCVLASFGIGNMTQINSIADAMGSNFNVPALTTGIALAVIEGLVILGGIKRIAGVTEKFVPFMAIAYMLGTIIIFLMNYKQIPYVFGSIFSSAFSISAGVGGVSGYAVKQAVTMGFKRGVFSNEAGLGSSVMVHSASDVKEPAIQGMWGIFEVFFDTIVVCTLTAFVLLSSSSNAMPKSEALANITTQTQFFSIADHIDESENVVLIDDVANIAFSPKTDSDGKTALQTEKADGGEYSEVCVYGKKYYIEMIPEEQIPDSDRIYTNIMAVSANAKTDANNNIVKDENNNPIVESLTFKQVNGVSLVTFAFSQHFGDFAGKFISIAVLLFAFSTVLGWSFYGTKSIEYLGGQKAVLVYKIIFIAFIVVGATMNLGLAWEIADTLNGLMAIPNLIAVLALSGTVFAITKNYKQRKIKKNNPNVRPMLSAFDDIQVEQEAALEAENI